VKTTSPIGTLTADKFTFDGTQYGRIEKTTTVTNGNTYTFSIYLKNNNLSDVTQVWIGFSLVAQGQFFTITNEWQRYSITVAANGSSEFPRVQFSGTGSLFAWGAQVEDQTQATPYIKTVGSPVTVEFYKENNYAEMVNLGGGADFSDGIKNGSPYAQLVQDSDFTLTGTQAQSTTGAYWITGAGWTISGGKATLVAQAGSSSLGSVVMSVTSGKTHKVTVNVSATSSGFRLYDSAGVVSYGLQLGENVFYTIPSSSSYQITPLGLTGASGTIDNVTLQEVNTGLQGYWKMGDGTNDEYPVIYDQVDPTLGSDLVTGDNSATTVAGTYTDVATNWAATINDVLAVTFTLGGDYRLKLWSWIYYTPIDSGIEYNTGTHTAYITVSQTVTYSNAGLRFNNLQTSTVGGTISNITIKKVQGNPATMIAMPEGNITNQYPLTKIRNYYRMGDGILDSKFLSYPATAAPFIFQDQTSPNLAHIPTTNLITYSEDFTGWLRIGSITTTPNYTTSPSGQNNATRLQWTNATNYIYQNLSHVGSNFTLSIYLKSNTNVSQNVKLFMDNGAQTQNVVVTTQWQRFEFTNTSTPTQSNRNTGLIKSNSQVGDLDISIWGAQFEEQSQATAYIKSDGIAAVRKATTTNLVTYSEDFSHSSWVKNNTTVTNNHTSPDGTQNAYLMTDNATDSHHGVYVLDLAPQDSNIYTRSVFVKKGTARYVVLSARQIPTSSGTSWIYDFDTNNFTLTGSSGVGQSIEVLTNGWIRLSVSIISDSNFNNDFSVGISSTSLPSGASYSGSGDTVYIYGGQVEQQTQVEKRMHQQKVYLLQ
jgi:hypothetical protein